MAAGGEKPKGYLSLIQPHFARNVTLGLATLQALALLPEVEAIRTIPVLGTW